MSKYEETIIGAPCWVDLTSANLEAVKPFYKTLFDWDFADTGEQFGNYHIIAVGEDAVGGAMQYSPEFMGPDEISAWAVYFGTTDAEAALATAQAHGGAAISPAYAVPGQGTMAVAVDPSGSQYGLWQPAERKGFDRWQEPGFPGWFEYQTRDAETARTYYSAVLGAELAAEDMGEGETYHTLNINGEPQAGIFDATNYMPEGGQSFWGVYFIVTDTDAVVELAQQHGGKTLMEPTDSPYGRMAMILDPAGAFFFVISAD